MVLRLLFKERHRLTSSVQNTKDKDFLDTNNTQCLTVVMSPKSSGAKDLHV